MSKIQTVGRTKLLEINSFQFGDQLCDRKRYSISEKALAIESVLHGGMSKNEFSSITGVDKDNISRWIKKYKGVNQGVLITLKSNV